MAATWYESILDLDSAVDFAAGEALMVQQEWSTEMTSTQHDKLRRLISNLARVKTLTSLLIRSNMQPTRAAKEE